MPATPTQATTTVAQTWSVAALAQDVAAFACRFADPFWPGFTVNEAGTTRTVEAFGFAIVETLATQDDLSYDYGGTGVTGISDYRGTFAATGDGDGTALSWTVSFVAAPDTASPAGTSSLESMLTILAATTPAMSTILAARFPPPAG